MSTNNPGQDAATAPGAVNEESAHDVGAMPPATFGSVIQMFSAQAMVALGVIPNPVTKQADPQPRMARHFIDLLGILEDKTQGNLDPEEADFLSESLHHLRMAYTHQQQSDRD